MSYGLSIRDDSNSQTWEWTLQKSYVWSDLLAIVDTLPDIRQQIEDSINVLRNDLSDIDSIAQNAESIADKSEELSQSSLEKIEDIDDKISNAFEDIVDLQTKFLDCDDKIRKLTNEMHTRMERVESAISQQWIMIANISDGLVKLQTGATDTGQMYNPPEFASPVDGNHVEQETKTKG